MDAISPFYRARTDIGLQLDSYFSGSIYWYLHCTWDGNHAFCFAEVIYVRAPRAPLLDTCPARSEGHPDFIGTLEMTVPPLTINCAVRSKILRFAQNDSKC